MLNSRDHVEVKIGGRVHSGWTHYEIDSDLMTPADAWRVTLAQDRIELPAEVKEGALVEVRMNRDLVLTGRLDELELHVAARRHELQLNGRDGAAVLLDCSTPILTASDVTLEQVIAKIVKPLGVIRHRVDSDDTLLREKVKTEPGDSAWDSLRRAAEANGLWPWFEPDGTLVVGGPKYDVAPVATLVMRASGQDNNVLSLTVRRSIVGRFSEVTVYGQSHAYGSGAGERDSRNNIHATQRDTGVTVYRPKVLVDHEAVNESIARHKALKVISDSRVKGYTLTAVVRGHRNDDGLLWTPGQRITVVSEPHAIDGVYFLMARRFTGDKTSGQRTTLTLKEDGAWVPQAHPSKRRHRRGKNSLPGQILDIPGGGR